MIFSILRDFLANIANLFSSKPSQSKPRIQAKDQAGSSQIASSVSRIMQTVRYQAKKSVSRTSPKLEVVNIRFSGSSKKYLKEKKSKNLIAKTYAVGKDPQSVVGKVISSDEAIVINNDQVSRYHLSIEQVDGNAKSVFEKLGESPKEDMNHANIEKSLRSFR